MKRCDLCGEPVPDDVVPAENLAGALELDCMSCWIRMVEERAVWQEKS